MTPIADEAGTHVHKFGSVGVPIPGVSIKVWEVF